METKRQSIYKGYIDIQQSEFDRLYVCWAKNHRGWSKAKKINKRIAKRRERRDAKKRMEVEHETL